jgi:hypothetical protein
MVDIEHESLIMLAQASREIPGRPHLTTLHRWRLAGIAGVKLETLKIGGRRFTSREALSRFFAATTAAADGLSSPTRTSRQRQRDIERAEAELAKAGI